MFDGFKASTYDESLFRSLPNNQLLEWIQHVNMKTGEVHSSADYKGLKFEIFGSGRVQIEGSLHKYYNDGRHNWNDFTITNVADVLQRLAKDFNINPFKLTVNNLEFGVNITTIFNPDELINCLYGFKWRQFNVMDTVGMGYGKQCKRSSQYLIKFYNKGSQNLLKQYILPRREEGNNNVQFKIGTTNLGRFIETRCVGLL